jgi:hypothetical protein
MAGRWHRGPVTEPGDIAMLAGFRPAQRARGLCFT